MRVGKQPEFKKVIRIKEGKFEIFSKEYQNLDKNIAPVYEVEGGYVQKFKEFFGYIDDVRMQKRYVKRGDSKQKVYIIDVHIESGKEQVILQMDFDKKAGEMFARVFRNINLKKEITFMAWQLDKKEGQKYGTVGITLYHGERNDENKIHPFYDKNNMPEFTKRVRGEESYDKDAMLDWLFDQFIEDIHYEFNHYEDEEQKDSSRNDKGRDDRGNDTRDSGRGRDDHGRDDRGRDSGRGRDDRGRDERGRDSGRNESHGRDDRDSGRDSSRDNRGRDEGRGRDSDRSESRDSGREERGQEREYRSRDTGSSEREARTIRSSDRDTGRSEKEYTDDDGDDFDKLPF